MNWANHRIASDVSDSNKRVGHQGPAHQRRTEKIVGESPKEKGQAILCIRELLGRRSSLEPHFRRRANEYVNANVKSMSVSITIVDGHLTTPSTARNSTSSTTSALGRPGLHFIKSREPSTPARRSTPKWVCSSHSYWAAWSWSPSGLPAQPASLRVV